MQIKITVSSYSINELYEARTLEIGKPGCQCALTPENLDAYIMIIRDGLKDLLTKCNNVTLYSELELRR